jgi:hypothetical protein
LVHGTRINVLAQCANECCPAFVEHTTQVGVARELFTRTTGRLMAEIHRR